MKWKKKFSILYHLTYNLSKSLCTSKSAIFYLFIYLFFYCSIILHIFPGSSGCKESPCHEEDLGSIPESGKSPQEGRELFGQRSLSGYSPWGEKKLDTTEWLTHTHTHNHFTTKITRLHPGGSDGKASAYNSGDSGSIPGLGRSPGEWNCNPLQYSCLKNAMDGGTW